MVLVNDDHGLEAPCRFGLMYSDRRHQVEYAVRVQRIPVHADYALFVNRDETSIVVDLAEAIELFGIPSEVEVGFFRG